MEIIMIRYIFLLTALLTFQSAVFSQDYIVSVAGKNYTSQDIENIMNTNNLELPDQAIQKLQRDAVAASLGKSEANLYFDFFGERADLDKARSRAKDLALISKRAETRGFIFESWLAKKAEKVPVKYLNIEKYWEMVKKTNSYQIRIEAGHKLSPDQIAYTPSELAIANDQVIATRNKQSYLTGKDYNDYLNSNYDLVRDFVKRGKTLPEAQNYLIARITGESISSETMNPQISRMNELEMERHVSSFIKKHMFDNPLRLKGCTSLSPSEVMDSMFLNFEKKNASQIGKFKAAISSGSFEKNDAAINSYIKNMKVDLVKKDINGKILNAEIRDWMKSTNFPGAFNEAKYVLMNKKYEEHVSKAIQDNSVELVLVK